MTLLGIDERTAAVWDGSAWRVLGPGGVTVVSSEGLVRFGPGEECSGIPAPDPDSSRLRLSRSPT
jgi:hypothetical protein